MVDRGTQTALNGIHSGKVKFTGDGAFHAELKRRVQEYFARTGLSPHGDLRMYIKTGAMLLWFAGSYAFLVFAATNWWQGVLFSFSLVLAMAGTGFAVQHDANHGAYSRKGFVNRLIGMTLDMLGASSYVWHWKHNVLHHTYPNLVGADQDINIQPFARLSPGQRRHWFHRVQHFYMWALYGLLLPKWHLLDDFQNVAQGRIALNRIPRPQGWRLVEMIAGKLAFFAWAVVIPLLFHRWWVVLLFYAAASFLVGLILAIVFQLAHCVEEAEFPCLPAGADRMADGWAEHQVHNTVDFARGNVVLTWYLGGLNFQVEHHLFPKVCHVHYPQLSSIVEEVCAQHGVRYAAHEGFFGAVSSHWRWLRRMGRAPVLSAPPA
jgi:linoleoyl-CoA desaturase